jgi:hypothetical protein
MHGGLGFLLKEQLLVIFYLLLLTCLLSCSLQPKHQKHFAAITIYVPTCEPIPSAPHGFDNLFLLKGTTITPPTFVGYHVLDPE